jgi:hypothetical protein
MKKHLLTIGMSISLISTIAPVALAAEPAPTMNQPDNGFYEGPSPEWATLHSTDVRGTAEHRQYHREAVQILLQWMNEHRPDQGTSAYSDALRVMHQNRNMDHRHFHTDPEEFDPMTNSNTPIEDGIPVPRPVSSTVEDDRLNGIAPFDHTYTSRPSRRSIVDEVEARNALSAERR